MNKEQAASHEFCDHCPGCRPAVFDPATGKVFQNDSEIMMTINRVWDKETSYAERKAFIEVTLHNSRASEDLRLAGIVMSKIRSAAK